MDLKVKRYIMGKSVKESELNGYTITNPIILDVIEQAVKRNNEMAMKTIDRFDK